MILPPKERSPERQAERAEASAEPVREVLVQLIRKEPKPLAEYLRRTLPLPARRRDFLPGRSHPVRRHLL